VSNVTDRFSENSARAQKVVRILSKMKMISKTKNNVKNTTSSNSIK